MQGSFLCLVIFHVTREVISRHQRLLPVRPQLFFSFHIREQGVRQTAERLKHIAVGKSKYLSSTVGFNAWRKLHAAFAQRMRYSLFCMQQFEKQRQHRPRAEVAEGSCSSLAAPSWSKDKGVPGFTLLHVPCLLQRQRSQRSCHLLRAHGAAGLPGSRNELLP